MSSLKTYGGFLALSFLMACAPEEEASVMYFSQPEHFPAAAYTFKNNALTKEGLELGRMLFYDPVLSRDGTVSCANCHLQAVAFSDPVHKISVGVNDRMGTRNAPPVFNLAFRNSFFWDGGVEHVDFIPLNAITNPNEMDEDISRVVDKLRQHDKYPVKFKAAFNKSEVTTQQMLFALSQFMVSMVSASSPYDRYIQGEKSALTAQQIRGMKLVNVHCASCHTPPLFTNDSFANNGIDDTFQDKGRALITETAEDMGKFRVPTLRNVELTGPYMHDGRFRTLEQVLTHYQQDVKESPTLDPLLRRSDRTGIPITTEEKADVIAFLKALTDMNFIKDKRFSNPFLP